VLDNTSDDEYSENAQNYGKSKSEQYPDIIRTPAEIYKNMVSMIHIVPFNTTSTFNHEDSVSIMKSNVVENEDLESMDPKDLDEYLFGREIAKEYCAKLQVVLDTKAMAVNGEPDELKNVC